MRAHHADHAMRNHLRRLQYQRSSIRRRVERRGQKDTAWRQKIQHAAEERRAVKAAPQAAHFCEAQAATDRTGVCARVREDARCARTGIAAIA